MVPGDDLLLGRLVELVVDGGHGLELHRPRGRWLVFSPEPVGPNRGPDGRWKRREWHGQLWAVRRGRRIGGAAEAARVAVGRFYWSPDLEADSWETFRPTGRGEAVGELAAVVYLATKGDDEQAEWEHWFRRRPQVRRTRDGEWLLVGRVAVSDRGILS